MIDPGHAMAEGDIDVVFHLFDGLVQFKNRDLEVEPALATDWDVSEDGKTWTFQLRKGVKFHDGTDFNADAVVHSFKRILDKDHKFYGLIKGNSYLDYLLGDIIEDVVKMNDYEVKFELKRKFAPFLTYMGYYSQFVVSPAALEKYGEDFINHPVGTGPFKFKRWKKGEYLELTANEDYWGEKPKIDSLVFKVVPESSTRLMELQNGSVDAIKNIDPKQLETIEKNDELKALSVPGANTFFMSINTEKEPFDDVKVRQALNHAVNTKRIVENIYEGDGTRAINFMPPTVFSFDKNAGPYRYDPDQAKALLQEAGYEDGFKVKLNTFEGARTYVSQPVQAAELIASDLKKIGLDVEIETNEWAKHADIMDNGKHELSLTGWFDVPYPSNFLKTLALEGSRTKYHPEDLQEKAKKALATYDEEKQLKLYQELQQGLHEGAPIVPIAHSNYSAAVRSDVKGFVLDNLGVVRAHKASKK
ncbi:ABC transporter substrate-binding protein [Melghirimyces profundicolus]|nr:ABC transporter substrate-binding protein [Melghirimyces profundicolus]